jgi:hypothetical protein
LFPIKIEYLLKQEITGKTVHRVQKILFEYDLMEAKWE